MFLLTWWRLALDNPNPNPSIEGNSDMIEKPYEQLKYVMFLIIMVVRNMTTDFAWPKWREFRQYENIDPEGVEAT